MNKKKHTVQSLILWRKLKIQISIVLLLLVLLIAHPSAVQAETVLWEDDFDDKDLEGWEVVTYYSTDPLNVGHVKGEVLIQNKNNQMLFLNPGNDTHSGFNMAERNSNQIYGHWSFDVNITAGSICGFFFVGRDLTPETDFEDEEWTLQTPIGHEAYFLFITTHPGEDQDNLVLLWIDADYTSTGGIDGYLLDSISFDDMDYLRYDVFDIDITRKQDGNITVFVKPTIDDVYTKAMSVIDNTYTISDKVVFMNQYTPSSSLSSFDTSFDNIRVDNNSNWVPEIWTTPPNSTPAWTPIVVFLAFIAIILQKRRKGGR
ncbi:MAG: hypothetical protein ACFFAE_16625 [Candidatus Hodarchaeota archaeon]